MPADRAVPSSATMLEMLAGYRLSAALAAMAKLDIADLLSDGPHDLAHLAQRTGAQALSLSRLLRFLAAYDVVRMAGPSRYELTPLGACLQSKALGSLRMQALAIGEAWYWQPWGDLTHSIQTGEAAFPRVMGEDQFTYLAHHPEAQALFDRLMASASDREVEAVLAAYDFSRFRSVVDVGGGHGRMLTAVLQAHPAVQGVLFDQPHVVAGAAGTLEEGGVTGRCRVVGGDFLAAVHGGGDLYLLKRILNDWPDEQAAAILRNCHRAMAPGTTLLVIDHIVPEDPHDGRPALHLDLLMLVQLAGKQRTEAEWRALLAESGFIPTQTLATAATISVLEATRQ